MAHPLSIDVAQTMIRATLEGYPGTESQRPQRLSEEQVCRISELLERADRIKWSRIPRIYAVLHMINKVDIIESFVDQGMSDLWFPFATRTLPYDSLNPSSRYDFLQVQDLVLTKGVDLEREDGKHRHFASSEDVPLRKLGELGKGGSSRVDLVYSTITRVEYARKMITRGKTFEMNAKKLKDFERELNSLKKLHHKHIVRLVGSYTDPKFVCILTSPVADVNLKVFLTSGSLTVNQRSLLRTFYGCLATAVQYLHDNKVRHKDIKPQNILVKGHEVFLTDFGIALDWSDTGQNTTTGHTIKTEKYCAPEVAQNRARNESSDLWSLGCVFLEMWTILKGETLQNLNTYMENISTGKVYYHDNVDAVMMWCTKLTAKNETADEDPTRDWIFGTVQVNPSQRWSVKKLISCIADTHDDPQNHLSFFGQCCAPSDGLTTSDMSSERSSLDETGISTINVYEPTRNLTQQIRDEIQSLDHPSEAKPHSGSGMPQDKTSEVDTGNPLLGQTPSMVEGNSPLIAENTTPVQETSWISPAVTAIPQKISLSQNESPQSPHEMSSISQQTAKRLGLAARSADEPALEESSRAISFSAIDAIKPQRQSLMAQINRTRSAEEACVMNPGSKTYIPHVFDGPQPQSLVQRVETMTERVQSSMIYKTNTIESGEYPGVDGENARTRLPEQFLTQRQDSRQVEEAKVIPLANISMSGVELKSSTLEAPTTTVDWGKSSCLRGHKFDVGSVAFSPDGKLLASSSLDKTVRLWDLATGQTQQTLSGHSDSIWSIAFSPDGKLLASGSWDGTVRLWDLDTGQTRRTLADHSGYIYSVAFSPNSKLLASGSKDKIIRLWDLMTGQVCQTLSCRSDSIWSIAFSPDGKLLASGSGDKTVRLWDVTTGQTCQILSGHSDSVWSVAFSPDSRLLASGSMDRTVRLWDSTTGQTLQTLSGHLGCIYSVSFSPDGKLLALGSGDSTVQLWDPATGQSQTLLGHSGCIYSVAFSPDGRLLASGSLDKTVRLWSSKLSSSSNDQHFKERRTSKVRQTSMTEPDSKKQGIKKTIKKLFN